MPKQFETPPQFGSQYVGRWKQLRREREGKHRIFDPSELKVGSLTIKFARHFGFCFGVENAVDVAYRALRENQDAPVFLLSQMIHNPRVNRDLENHGVRFLFHTDGSVITPLSALTDGAVVILPAFGVALSVLEELKKLNVTLTLYDATCPFVEKVWRRSHELGQRGFAVILHGKHYHEETRATFSRAGEYAPCLIIRDMSEAELLGDFIKESVDESVLLQKFSDRMTSDFSPEKHLLRFGVVNQTTMLAEETREISAYLRRCLIDRFGEDEILEHFADTRDTLCYATSENQQSVYAMLQSGGEIALVVGGFNSSNTVHLAKICLTKLPTFHIEGAENLISKEAIENRDFTSGEIITSENWTATVSSNPTVLITAGASTPDSIVDEVVERVCKLFGVEQYLDQAWSTVFDTSMTIESGEGKL